MGLDSDSQAPCFLSASRAVTFLAIADRVIPAEGPLAPGAKSEATLQAAEVFVQSQDESVRKKLAVLLSFFEWGAVFKFGRRFSHLPAQKQDAYLRAWEFSRLQLFRFGFSSVRNLVLISFYTQPTSWAMIDYPGPVLESKAAKL